MSSKKKSNKTTTTSSTVDTEQTTEEAVVQDKVTESDVTTEETETIAEEETKVEETPIVEEKTTEEAVVQETEVKSGKVEMSGSASDVQVEMSKKYKVKFAQSYFMKTCAANRELSLFSILETWMVNRSAYIGLLNMTDYDYIKKFMEANTITYKYKVVSAETKQQFLSKLNFNTQYAVSHK